MSQVMCLVEQAKEHKRRDQIDDLRRNQRTTFMIERLTPVVHAFFHSKQSSLVPLKVGIHNFAYLDDWAKMIFSMGINLDYPAEGQWFAIGVSYNVDNSMLLVHAARLSWQMNQYNSGTKMGQEIKWPLFSDIYMNSWLEEMWAYYLDNILKEQRTEVDFWDAFEIELKHQEPL